MLVAFGVLWGVSAYGVGRAMQPQNCGRGRMAFMPLALVAAGLACAMWSIGRHGIPSGLWGVLPLVGASYAFFPRLVRAAGFSWRQSRHFMVEHARCFSFAVLSLVAAILYVAGWALGSVILRSLAAFTVVFALRSLLLLLRPVLARTSPVLVARVFASEGNVYLGASLVALTATIAVLASTFEGLAEYTSIVFYFSLLMGIVEHGRALRADRITDA
jgi:hypothetical protein